MAEDGCVSMADRQSLPEHGSRKERHYLTGIANEYLTLGRTASCCWSLTWQTTLTMNQMTRPTARKAVCVLGESSPKLAQNCVTEELRYKAYKGAFVFVVFLEIQL
jgi:hypothetical protein